MAMFVPKRVKEAEETAARLAKKEYLDKINKILAKITGIFKEEQLYVGDIKFIADQLIASTEKFVNMININWLDNMITAFQNGQIDTKNHEKEAEEKKVEPQKEKEEKDHEQSTH